MSERNEIKLMVAQSIYLPSLPNFVRFADGGCVGVEKLSELQLNAIADAWKAALKEHAHQRRRLLKKPA